MATLHNPRVEIKVDYVLVGSGIPEKYTCEIVPVQLATP
jgi:hypothetical protein